MNKKFVDHRDIDENFEFRLIDFLYVARGGREITGLAKIVYVFLVFASPLSFHYVIVIDDLCPERIVRRMVVEATDVDKILSRPTPRSCVWRKKYVPEMGFQFVTYFLQPHSFSDYKCVEGSYRYLL